MSAPLLVALLLAAQPALAQVTPAPTKAAPGKATTPPAVKPPAKAPAVAPQAAAPTPTPAASPAPTSTPAPTRKPTLAKLAVLDVVLTGRDAAGLDTAALTELVAGAVEDRELFRMTTARDVSAMLGFEKMKQMSGCTEDTSCLAEIAGSLGVDYLVAASVGSLEGRLVVSGRLVDVKRASVLARSSETVSTRPEAAEALQRVGRRLRNGFRASRGLAPAQEEAPPAAPASAQAWGISLGAAAAPTESVVGGEVLLTLGLGRWEVAAGATVAERPAGRLAVSKAVAGDALSLRLGAKAVVGSGKGGATLGGGPAGWLRWRVASWLDADLVASAEYVKAPASAAFVPVVVLGLHAHGGP